MSDTTTNIMSQRSAETDAKGGGENVCNEVVVRTNDTPITLGSILRSQYFMHTVSILGFFALWHWAAVSNIFGTSALASPLQVVVGLQDLAANKLAGMTLWQHIWVSTSRVLIGFIIAVAIGLPMGLAMAFSPTTRAIVKPLFDMFKPMPPLAWISVAILWFGIGEAPKIFIIVIGSFVPVVLNSFSSVQLIEPELYDVVRTMGGSRWVEIRRVCIPGALPAITAGLQIAMSSAWTSVVAAELVNARSGLGFIITQGMKLSDPAMIIGGMVVITIISLIFTQGMEFLSGRLCPWQREIENL